MSEPFLSEIRMMGFEFAPRGWARCDGAVLSIAQQSALYALLGTQYGGDGRTTFALPDLRGRVPVGVNPRGGGYFQGAKGGREQVSLLSENLPPHTHTLMASSAAASATSPENAVLATAPAGRAPYAAPENLTAMSAQSVGGRGQGQDHNNVQPTQVVNFCIATAGVFPSRE